MKTLFEDQSTAQKIYSATKHELITVVHQGHDYIKIGKSYEKLNSVLSRVIQLIGIVVLSSLLIGIPFTFPQVRLTLKNLYKEITDKQEKIIHYIPKTEKLDAQYQAIYKITVLLKNILSSMPIDVQQVKLLINLKFDSEAIKKEFIVKPDTNNQFITSQSFKDTIYKILSYLEGDMDTYLDNHTVGSFQKVACAAIFKDQTNNFHPGLASYSAPNQIAINGLTGYNLQQLNAFTPQILNSVEFPQEPLIQNSDFLPGTFYQDLDAITVKEEV